MPPRKSSKPSKRTIPKGIRLEPELDALIVGEIERRLAENPGVVVTRASLIREALYAYLREKPRR